MAFGISCVLMAWKCASEGVNFIVGTDTFLAKDAVNKAKWDIYAVGTNLPALPDSYTRAFDREEMAELLGKVIKNARTILPYTADRSAEFVQEKLPLIEVRLIIVRLQAISQTVESILRKKRSWQKPIRRLCCIPWGTIRKRCDTIRAIATEMQANFTAVNEAQYAVYKDILEGMQVTPLDTSFKVAILVWKYLGIEEPFDMRAESAMVLFKAHEPIERCDWKRNSTVTIDVKHLQATPFSENVS